MTKYATNVYNPNIMKIQAGFPFSICFKIGNIKFTTATDIQFIIVEYGTMLGCTVSEMYIHTIGPPVNENTNLINSKDKHIMNLISQLASENAEKSILKKQRERIINRKAMARAPNSRLFFLPNILRVGIDKKAPVTAIRLMRIGKTFSIFGNIDPTISPEYAIIAPIPTICWAIAK